MKKILSVLIVICMIVGFAACGAPPGVAEQKQQDTDTLSDSDTASESDTESWVDALSEDTSVYTDTETDVSDEDAIPPDASEFAVELYNKYVDLSTENGFEVSDITYSNKFTEFSLVFGEFENDVSFYEDKKSFKVFINNDSAAKTHIKEVMSKVLMGIDDITADESKEIAQSIANSYSSDTFSDTQEIGDYLVILLPDESKYSNPFKYLKCIHKDELWEQVNKDEYPLIDRAMYEAPELNTGEKCKVIGTVTDWYIEPLPAGVYDGTAVIIGDDGNEYICSYSYENNPIKLEIDKKYAIYGSIEKHLEGKPYIWTEYPEKLN